MRGWLVAALLLAGCDRADEAQSAGAQLERTAIARGLVRDPADREIVGLYARDTDRLCIVRGADGYRLGASIDYGGQQSCSAAGSVERAGDILEVDLGNGCRFEARLTDEVIAFPGQVPADCQRLCTERASLSALEVDLQSDVPAEAAGLRDTKGRQLCS